MGFNTPTYAGWPLKYTMKWFLVVYFLSAGQWITAEQMGSEQHKRVAYPDAESCIVAQNQFTTQHDPGFVRASCEIDEY